MSDDARGFDHLDLAADLLRAWVTDPDSGETRRLLRVATNEFYPEETVKALLTLATGLIEGIGATQPLATPTHLLDQISAGLADAERTTP